MKYPVLINMVLLSKNVFLLQLYLTAIKTEERH